MIRLLIASLVLAGSVAVLVKLQAFAQSPNPVLLAPPAGCGGDGRLSTFTSRCAN
jgi:hypothetical protein